MLISILISMLNAQHSTATGCGGGGVQCSASVGIMLNSLSASC